MAKDNDRRTGLLKHAAHVFLEHGYEATSMNLIAERAEITKWFRPGGRLSNDEVAAQVTELALSAVLRDDRRGSYA